MPNKQGVPAPSAAQSSARARLVAEQKKQEQRRKRLILVAVPVAVVLIAVIALVAVKLVGSSGQSAAPAPASNTVIPKVTSVPESVLDQIGAGTATTPPKAIQAPALTENGKPKVLYIGAEYCPYCAAERWAMVVALSRFGTFSNLGLTHSAADDVYPSTPTLSFHGSSFTSDYIVFTGVETQGNEKVNGEYPTLDTPTAEDEQTFETYDSPPYTDSAGSIPFVDIGGKYLINGASYDPQVLQGKTHQQVADALSDPNSDIAKAVNGSANLITAAICASTADAPKNVCTSAGVTEAAKKLQ